MPTPFQASSSFLREMISTKLIATLDKVSIDPTSILTLNLTESAKVSLLHLYPHAKIYHLQLADIKENQLSFSDESIDLIIAQLGVARDIDLHALLSAIERVLTRKGMFVFTAYHVDQDNQLNPFIKESVEKETSSENKVLRALDQIEALSFSTIKEHLDVSIRAGESVNVDIFFASKIHTAQEMKVLGIRSFKSTEISENNEKITHSERKEVDEKKEGKEKEEPEEKEEHEGKEEPEEKEEHEEKEKPEAKEEHEEKEEPEEKEEHEEKEKPEAKEEHEEKEKPEEKEEHEEKEKPEEKEEHEEKEKPEEKEEHEEKEELEEKEEHEEKEEPEEKEEHEEKEESEEKEEHEEKEESEEKEEHEEKEESEEKEEHEDKEEAKEKEEHEDKEEAKEKEKLEEKEEPAEKAEPDVIMAMQTLANKMDKNKEILAMHAHKLTQHADSMKEILNVLSDASLSQEQRQAKMVELDKHHELHRAMLTDYQVLHQQHAELLTHFIESQESVLEHHPALADSMSEMIKQHKEVINQHEDHLKEQQLYLSRSFKL
jgi:hypothetical protein